MQEQKYKSAQYVITCAYMVLNLQVSINRKSHLSLSFSPSFFHLTAPILAGKYKLERMYTIDYFKNSVLNI